MTAPATSVVIVSRGRPEALVLCVTATAQLRYPNLEVVVVADPPGLAALSAAGWSNRIKTIPFDTPNISAARNLGLTAAGEIVAFLDDDAVPEPTWLTHLTAPFADPTVMAATGFVLARNGISFQWQARDARPDGSSHPLTVDHRTPTILNPSGANAIKTEGTNMAFRRTTLAALGGFDPVFRFYLDETDLNLRLMARTAVVPLAQVHHGFSPSDRRHPDRTPRDLHEIGASLAAFLRKHHKGDPQPVYLQERADQRRRLLTHMVAGRLEPRDVNRLLATFDTGWQDGMTRPLTSLPPIPSPTQPFLPLSTPTGPHDLLSARRLRTIAPRAKALINQGHTVTAVILSPTARPHRVRFQSEGYWLQTGGLFGKSLRTDPPFRFWHFRDRVEREFRRVALIRTDSDSGQKSP
ncbi:MAG: glycosyltransferase [Rhodobacterales bacterium]|nr:glycosyltransferase [Rhodobacterales bacterium]